MRTLSVKISTQFRQIVVNLQPLEFFGGFLLYACGLRCCRNQGRKTKGGNNEETFNLFTWYVYMCPCQGGNRNNKLVC